MNFITIHGRTLLLMAALAVGAVCLSGCSEKNNPGNQGGGNVVCEDGEAWILDDVEDGYIFRSNGDMVAVAVMEDGSWFGHKVGTYSTDGDNLTIVLGGVTDTWTYKVSGDKLTLSGGGNTVVYTKRTGVYVDV